MGLYAVAIDSEYRGLPLGYFMLPRVDIPNKTEIALAN